MNEYLFALRNLYSLLILDFTDQVETLIASENYKK